MADETSTSDAAAAVLRDDRPGPRRRRPAPPRRAADGRISIRALAERLHISRTNAYARLERLMADGVITGFSAQVDPEPAGFGTSAYVALTIEQNAWRDVSGAFPASRTSSTCSWAATSTCSWCWSAPRTTRRCATWCWSTSSAGSKGTRTWLIFEEFGDISGPAELGVITLRVPDCAQRHTFGAFGSRIMS